MVDLFCLELEGGRRLWTLGRRQMSKGGKKFLISRTVPQACG